MNLTIHPATLSLLNKMFEPEVVMNLLFSFMADYAEMQDDGYEGYPFMILQFGNVTPIMSPNETPPSESYIWN